MKANSETVRTYNEPDNRVVDHLTHRRGNFQGVVHGDDLGEFIRTRREAMHNKALDA